MDLTGITSSTSTSSSSPFQQEELGKDAFMNLLVTQLKNQDPLEPVANEDFVAQLATFSNLEQMEQVNENIVSMVLLQQGNALLEQLTSSAGLIGHTVSYENPETGAEELGTVETVKIEDGLAQLNIGGKDVPLANLIEVLGKDYEAPSAEDDGTDTTEGTDDAGETGA